MKNKFTKKDLLNFEKEVIKQFKKGETYGPVHLSGGNEDELLKIFKLINKNDWVFSTHRSHYHSLLKSQDKKWLMNEIIKEANSSHINSKKHKIFTSAIVGGIIPIALGVAMGIKRKKKKDKVYCFVGDFAAQMGCFNEAAKYAEGEKLPITFIIENNNIGCNTPLISVWKKPTMPATENIIYYEYKRKYPHYGIGEWVIMADEKLKTKGDYNSEKIK